MKKLRMRRVGLTLGAMTLAIAMSLAMAGVAGAAGGRAAAPE